MLRHRRADTLIVSYIVRLIVSYIVRCSEYSQYVLLEYPIRSGSIKNAFTAFFIEHLRIFIQILDN